MKPEKEIPVQNETPESLWALRNTIKSADPGPEYFAVFPDKILHRIQAESNPENTSPFARFSVGLIWLGAAAACMILHFTFSPPEIQHPENTLEWVDNEFAQTSELQITEWISDMETPEYSEEFLNEINYEEEYEK